MTFFGLKVIAAAAELVESMGGSIRRAISEFIPALIIISFFAWSWVPDWQEEAWGQSGKLLVAIVAAAVMGGLYIARAFHWTVAAFFVWAVGQWIRARFSPMGVVEITTITSAIFVAIFVVREDRTELLPRCLIIDAGLQTALGLIEVAGYFPFHPNPKTWLVWPPMGALGNATLLGPYLACALPFLLCTNLVKNTRFDRALRIGIALLILICFPFTQSTMSWITLGVVSCLTLGFLAGPRMLGIAAGIALPLGAGALRMVPGASDFSGRLAVWQLALDRLTWTGHGAGSWLPFAYQRHLDQLKVMPEAPAVSAFFGQVHMDPLQGAFEFGKLGMVPLVAAAALLGGITLRAMARREREIFPWACLLWGILADSTGSFPMHTLPMGFLVTIAACRLFQFDFAAGAIRAHYRETAADDSMR